MEYIPEAGDVVWLNFDPQSGHEQAGHRPALVISPASYNGRTGLMLCCPLTSQIKGYPFEVAISGTRKNVALADQIKSLDWRARGAVKKETPRLKSSTPCEPEPGSLSAKKGAFAPAALFPGLRMGVKPGHHRGQLRQRKTVFRVIHSQPETLLHQLIEF